jgi:hypothetical protein
VREVLHEVAVERGAPWFLPGYQGAEAAEHARSVGLPNTLREGMSKDPELHALLRRAVEEGESSPGVGEGT